MLSPRRIFLFIALFLVLFLALRNVTGNTHIPYSVGLTAPPPSANKNLKEKQNDSAAVTAVAEHLDTPWGIAFLPDNTMLITERPGRVRRIDQNGELDPTPAATLENVREIGEGGLLGIIPHPNFSSNKYVYLYYTYSGSGNNTRNRVVRMTYQDNKLAREQIIVDAIPGASIHNGGRIKFGPDGYLYITTGDAQDPSLAQDRNSLAGKILRVTDDGKAAPGNPFGNLVYSYGHRNPQGLAWSESGTLYETEHGQSATDEFNYIEPGKNYGWPTIRGSQTHSGMESPFLQSGNDTWAPGGAAYYQYADSKVSVFFGGLRGQALFEIEFKGDNRRILTHFKGEFGRIRDVVVGPDGMLYITTSNRDGRGNPAETDDRVLRINPNKF